MSPRRCWVLNLDAEHELEARGSYTASRHSLALVAAQRKPLLTSLLAPGDVLLTHENLAQHKASGALRGVPGHAWCPTPQALSMLRAVGATPTSAPSIEILRQVNGRPFATAVRAPLAGASFQKHTVDSLDQALAVLACPAEAGWLVRRHFGAAGRGRRRMRRGRPDSAEQAWLSASLRSGPLTLEPWVEIQTEFTRSGWVTPQGEVQIAPPCFQQTTPQGAWTHTATADADAVSTGDDQLLEQAVEEAGRALACAGYFGAFGIDAFRHRVPGGTGQRVALNPMSEINARFTMDWALGMGARQPHDGAQGSEAVRG